MSSLNIILPVVALVVVIICGIAFFFLLKKCVRWRAVSLVGPKQRTISDENMIQNSVYTVSSVDGHYQSLGSLPIVDIEQISSRINPVEDKKYIIESLPQNPEFNKRKNSFRKSFGGKFAQVASMSQEIIFNKKHMGVYNIPENELKYYKENRLRSENNGETNINFEYSDLGEDLEVDSRSIHVECNLTSNSNLKIDEMSNEPLNSNRRIGDEVDHPLSSNRRTEVSNEPLKSNFRVKEVLIEPLPLEARQRIEQCLKNKFEETNRIQKMKATPSVGVSEEIIRNNEEITEQETTID